MAESTMDEFNPYVPPTTKISFQSDKKFDVFLSFMGKDTRKTLVDHLYEALSAKGLRVFLDTYELEKGENIIVSLEEAIKSSTICIPIFSIRYAKSAWCLREATWILNSTGRIIPLFYCVEPTNVRYPQRDRSPYAKYFAKHYSSSRYPIEEVDRWKQSLQEICALSGWSTDLTGGYEGQLIKRVTLDVINSLDKVPLDVATHPVGLEDMKQGLIQKLDITSTNDVIQVGILGLGGIGKTTLAKAIYNEVRHGFDGSSFVFNVRSTAEENGSGLRELQRRILKDLVNYDAEVPSVEAGKASMRDRLRRVRALLILDDVNSSEQLQALLADWMAPGSRVVVTSRDRHVLNLAQISDQFIFEMSGLKENEALQLFSWHAFLRSSPNQQYEDVSNRIVKACKGHPLSLEVIGAFLYDKKKENDIECWKETLLNIGGREEIFKTLHISYNGLSQEEKKIFLDIACFFKGEDKRHPILFWKSLGYKMVNSAICNLSMKLLLKIDDQGVFDMHDHLQEMGRTIVENEFPGDPYHERSRVWKTEHACQLLNNNLNNQYTNISRLRLQGGSLPHIEGQDTPMLRFLHMKDTKIKGREVKLTPILIWLRLQFCSFASEDDGKRKRKRKRNSSVSPSSSVSPEWGPHFSFGDHDWQLRIMELEKCGELQTLPSSIDKFSKLQSLTVSNCYEMKNLPDSLGKLSQLECLVLDFSRLLENLPNTIGDLTMLKSLDLTECISLKKLPDTLGNLSRLRSLSLSGCGGLRNLPDTFGELTQLESLNMSGCYLKHLPDSFGNLSQLKSLDLYLCDNLKTLPDSFGNLSQLKSLELSSCNDLKTLPDSFGNLSQLESLDMRGCNHLETLPDSFGNLSQLKSLDLSSCNHLKTLPDSFGNLSQLKSLDLYSCDNLKTLPDSFGNLSQLKSLDLYSCDNLKTLPDSFGNLSQLESLDMRGCNHLKTLPDSFGNLSQLRHLKLDCCESLKELPDTFGNLTQLECLNLLFSNVETLPDTLGNVSHINWCI